MAPSSRYLDPPSSPTHPLAFSHSGGPLVAVTGLAGGAGASTLAHLLAAAAASSSSTPVLLAETGGPFATLRLLAGAESRRPLVALARELDAGQRSADPPFALSADGLRVIAAGPQFECDVASESAIELVLDDARAAHGLTVVDCTSLTRTADLVALRRASHIVWVTTATEMASVRAASVLDAVDLPMSGRELLAVRHDESAAAPLTTWTAIARRRDADVVLVPRVAGIDELPLVHRLERVALMIDALAGALR